MKILFVDDEKIIREGISMLIDWKKIGCEELRIASSAKQAISIIEDYEVDLIITDIYMQEMSGIEFAKYIRKYKPSIKVIILSAYESFDYAREAIEAGVIKYLLKPILPEELEAAINEAMTMIDNQITLRNKVEESERIVNIYRPIMARDFWKSLINEEIKEKEEVIKDANLSGIILPDESISCLMIAKKDQLKTKDSMFCYNIQNIAEKLLGDKIVDIVEFHTGTIIIIIKNKLEQINMRRLETKIVNKVEDIYISQGKTVKDVLELPYSFKNAYKKIVVYQNLNKDNQVAIQELGSTEKITQLAITIMEENFYKVNLSVKEIASQLHVSTSYLSRIFKKQAGKTCLEYITTLRIDKAKELLLKTELKQDQIAQEIGYSNMYYFNHQFKKQTGVTPGNYRKRVEK